MRSTGRSSTAAKSIGLPRGGVGPPRPRSTARRGPRAAPAGSERQDGVGGESHLMVALAGVERVGAVQRRIVADLGADDEAFNRLRNLRLIVDAESEGAVGGAAAADRGGGKKPALGI